MKRVLITAAAAAVLGASLLLGTAQAREAESGGSGGHGRDDRPGHGAVISTHPSMARGGKDDGAGHDRRGRGNDDGPNHDRRGGNDDGPGHA